MYTTQVMPRVGLTNEGRSASISGGHLARTSTEIWVKSYKRDQRAHSVRLSDSRAGGSNSKRVKSNELISGLVSDEL